VRILLVNAFHYLRGGVERTYLDESRWLQARGHQVAHFATRHPRNLPCAEAAYFPPAADLGEGAPLGRQLGHLPRAVHSRPARAAMERLLADFRPDIVHAHAPSRYLSMSWLRAVEAAGVPAVMTLHDFKRYCTNRILFARGAPCERCRGGRHYQAWLTGCVQDSRLKSAVGMVEAYVHDWTDAYRGITRWVAPSQFVARTARSFGVPGERLAVIGHGVEPRAAAAPAPLPERYVLFLGRLSVEKGVRLLPDLARAVAPRAVAVAGEGPLAGWLADRARSLPNLRLLGFVDEQALGGWIAHAAAVAAPSLFYEHFGYVVAEALLAGRPVVASAIGALPELVEHERTGLLVPPGDGTALGAAARRALEDPAASTWGERARAELAPRLAPERHVEALEALYREVAGNR
jgi:glycosyltransferase involved in cell wall biosynthesis